MRHRNAWTLTVAGLAMLAASACATTKWVNTWTEPAAAGLAPMKKVLVIGMSPDMANRRIFEDTLVTNFKNVKVEATPSYSVLPEGEVSEDVLKAKVKEGGYDGVIITRLIDKDEKVEYVPPSGTAMYGGYGPYWHGYGGWYGATYSPGYLKNTTVVRVQTRLWSTAGDAKPVWTGVSEAVDPGKVSSWSNEQSYLVIQELQRNKLI
jgi:hypothetical protein